MRLRRVYLIMVLSLPDPTEVWIAISTNCVAVFAAVPDLHNSFNESGAKIRQANKQNPIQASVMIRHTSHFMLGKHVYRVIIFYNTTACHPKPTTDIWIALVHMHARIVVVLKLYIFVMSSSQWSIVFFPLTWADINIKLITSRHNKQELV